MNEISWWILLFLLTVNALYTIRVYWKIASNKKDIIEGNKYFYLTQAVLCSNCDCVFCYKDYKKCPSCGNDVNFYINLSLQSIDQERVTLQ